IPANAGCCTRRSAGPVNQTTSPNKAAKATLPARLVNMRSSLDSPCSSKPPFLSCALPNYNHGSFSTFGLTPRVAAPVCGELLIFKQNRQFATDRRRAPNLTPWDRLMLGVCALFVSSKRLSKVAVILKPSTLLGFHHALVKRKYQLLYSPRKRRRPGPKGPSKELISAVIEMKRRNPRFGCRKIAEQLSRAFAIEINKDVVRRILIQHYRPVSGSDGPSWLTVIGHAKDSLWSVDLFRCESILLKSYWIMVVMDIFTRRIIGFSVAVANLDGPIICRMFNRAIAKQ